MNILTPIIATFKSKFLSKLISVLLSILIFAYGIAYNYQIITTIGFVLMGLLTVIILIDYKQTKAIKKIHKEISKNIIKIIEEKENIKLEIKNKELVKKIGEKTKFRKRGIKRVLKRKYIYTAEAIVNFCNIYDINADKVITKDVIDIAPFIWLKKK